MDSSRQKLHIQPSRKRKAADDQSWKFFIWFNQRFDFSFPKNIPKKVKAVIFFSSSHHYASTDEETNKPSMIVNYNHSKGVDEIDKKNFMWPHNTTIFIVYGI